MTRSRLTPRASRPDPSGLDPLVLDLVEWLERAPRSYAEVMEAWRTSCPRLTVWEDALDRGLVVREHGGVVPTDAGRAFLRAFSSEADAGSRQENASKQKPGAGAPNRSERQRPQGAMRPARQS